MELKRPKGPHRSGANKFGAPAKASKRERETPLEGSYDVGDSYLFAVQDACSHVEIQPEKALLMAILADAIQVVSEPSYMDSAKTRMLRANTVRWMKGEEGKGAHFTFVEICHHLDLEPDETRVALLQSERRFRSHPKVWKR